MAVGRPANAETRIQSLTFGVLPLEFTTTSVVGARRSIRLCIQAFPSPLGPPETGFATTVNEVVLTDLGPEVLKGAAPATLASANAVLHSFLLQRGANNMLGTPYSPHTLGWSPRGKPATLLKSRLILVASVNQDISLSFIILADHLFQPKIMADATQVLVVRSAPQLS